MSGDPFDRVFGPRRGHVQAGSDDTDLADLQAWLAQWGDKPARAVSVIKHADNLVEVSVRVAPDDDGPMEEHRHQW
jgi:hypothetical protein